MRRVLGSGRRAVWLCLALSLLCQEPAAVRARRNRHHHKDELIGWQGEVHSTKEAVRDPGNVLDLWDTDASTPLGVDQWTSWYNGYRGETFAGDKYTLLSKRERFISPSIGLKGFADAGFAGQVASLNRPVDSTRVFPHASAGSHRSHSEFSPRYAHMATIARVPHNGSLALAFQASSNLEGGDGQKIWLAFSKAAGEHKLWWPPQPVGMREGGTDFGPPENGFVAGAQWGPVLHADEQRGRLWLIYSESGEDCHEPGDGSQPGRWVVGGHIKATYFDGGSWSEPKVLLSHKIGGIPKITANGVTVHSSGAWVLPFWRQKPRHIFVNDPATGASSRRCLGIGKRKTSAGVLISKDQGATWAAHAALEHRTAGWLIENTVVELEDQSLWMLFRTKGGVLFASQSTDVGQTWSPAVPLQGMVNPDSKVHAITMRDGSIALAWNDHPRPFINNEGSHFATRERLRLVVSVSRDQGKTWKRVARVDKPRKVNADFASSDADAFKLRGSRDVQGLSEQYHYPYLLETQAPSCNLLVAYTRSKLEVISQFTSHHEIWVSCVRMGPS